MLEIIIGSIAVVIIFALLVVNVVLRIKTSKIVAEKMQEAINTEVLMLELNKIKEELDTLKLQETDGFVKFLSESREWAFNYIDDVQASIAMMKDAMDNGDSQRILEAFNQLVGFLPNEEKNKEMK